MNPPIPSFLKRALLATALLGAGQVYAADADGIVVYNAQHESLTKAWVEGFTEETGIKVTVRNGDDTEMGNQIVQEGAASPADVFLTENSPAMVLVDNAGLFAPVAPTTLEQVGRGLPPGPWQMDGHRRALHGVRLQPDQTAPKPSCPNPCWTWPRRAGKAAGPPRRPVPTSRPSSPRCWNSRAKPPPSTGSRR